MLFRHSSGPITKMSQLKSSVFWLNFFFFHFLYSTLWVSFFIEDLCLEWCPDAVVHLLQRSNVSVQRWRSAAARCFWSNCCHIKPACSVSPELWHPQGCFCAKVLSLTYMNLQDPNKNPKASVVSETLRPSVISCLIHLFFPPPWC